MVTRVEPDLSDTGKLIAAILPIALQGERVAFYVDAGTAGNVLARIRTMLSRHRTNMRNRGRKVKEFMLRSSVHPETVNGSRKDCIIVWTMIHENHMMTELFDDMMSRESVR